jgi:membrane protein implicated in regulation of membrane protease activity
MIRRQHGSKPAIALWMLVAVADVALLAAAAGPLTMMLIVAALVIVAGAFHGMRMISRREPEPVQVRARRRA